MIDAFSEEYYELLKESKISLSGDKHNPGEFVCFLSEILEGYSWCLESPYGFHLYANPAIMVKSEDVSEIRNILRENGCLYEN